MKKFVLMFLAVFVAATSFAQLPLKRQSVFPQSGKSRTAFATAPTSARTLGKSLKKAPRRAAADFPIISETPEGDLQQYSRAGGYYISENQSIYIGDQQGLVEIVYAADNKVYIKDIVNSTGYGTWVEGTIAGNTITVPMFQNVSYSARYDAALVIGMIKYDSKNGFVLDETVKEVTFTVNGDGTISLNGTAIGSTSLGIYWSDDPSIIQYPGDYETVLTPFTEDFSVVTPPAGLQTQVLPISCSMSLSTDEEPTPYTGSVTYGITDDNTIYMKGLVPFQPEAWLKGIFNSKEHNATFPTQCIGKIAGTDYFFGSYDNTTGAYDAYTLDFGNGFGIGNGFAVLNPNSLSLDFDNYYGVIESIVLGTLPQPVTMPETAEKVELPMYGEMFDGETIGDASGSAIVGIDGNNIYIQGLFPYIEDGCIQGEFNQEYGVYVFPTGQYVGLTEGGTPLFLQGMTMSEEEGESQQVVDDVYFSYDDATGAYTLLNYLILNACPNITNPYLYYNPSFTLGDLYDVTWVASKQDYANEQTIAEIVFNEELNTKATLAKGGGINVPKYFEDDAALRMFQKNTMTITSDKAMVSIIVTMSAEDEKHMQLEATGQFTLEDGICTWTGKANEVTFTVPNVAGAQARIKRIDITYFDATQVEVELPAGAQTQDYYLVADAMALSDTEPSNIVVPIKVAFVENDVYVQGLALTNPDAWVMGTIENNEVYVDTWSMGNYVLSETAEYPLFFSGATFSYDATSKSLKSDAGFAILIAYQGSYMPFSRMSNVVITNDLTPVQGISAAPISDVRYFDLQGRAASTTAKGVLIQQRRMSDGSVKTTKVVRK